MISCYDATHIFHLLHVIDIIVIGAIFVLHLHGNDGSTILVLKVTQQALMVLGRSGPQLFLFLDQLIKERSLLRRHCTGWSYYERGTITLEWGKLSYFYWSFYDWSPTCYGMAAFIVVAIAMVPVILILLQFLPLMLWVVEWLKWMKSPEIEVAH